jgi:hypothetical protein
MVTAALVACSGEPRPVTPAIRSAPPVAATRPAPAVVAGTCFAITTGDARGAPPGVTQAPDPADDQPADLGGAAGAGGMSTPAGGSGGRRVPPPVQIGRPATTGYDQAILYRYVRRLQPRLRSCHQRALQRDPDASGTVTVDFVIASNGVATGVTARGMSAGLNACVEAAFQALQVPAPQQGAIKVRLPLRFRATHPEPAAAPEPVPVSLPLLSCTAIDPVLTGEALVPLERCFRDALGRDPGLSAHLIARAGARVEVTGSQDDALLACAGEALSGLAGAEQRVCSFALINPAAAASVPEAVRLEISPTMVHADGTALLYTADIDQPGVLRSARRTLEGIVRNRVLEGRRPSEPEPAQQPLMPRFIALRAHPALDARTVLLVRDALLTGGSLRSELYSRAVGTTDAWLAVNPLGTPDYGCAPVDASVTLHLDASAARIGDHAVAIRDGDFDLADLGRALASADRGSRTDLVIEVAPEVTYRTLVNVVEAAIAAGFVDTRVELTATEEPR